MINKAVKILLVEDSEDDYIFTRDMLRNVGEEKFFLTWAKNLTDALDCLLHETPDVMLVDWALGGQTGLDFLHAARATGVRVPAILLTGQTNAAVEEEALRAGVSDYLEKGQISGALLERTIHFALERQDILNRLEQANEALDKRVTERTGALEVANAALREVNTALAASNELFERMFSSIHLHIAYLDRDFNFIRVNRRYAEEDEQTVSYFPGKNHFDLYPNAENQAIFQQVIDSGEPFITQSRPFVYPDHPERGVTYWDWHLLPVKEADGSVSGVIMSLLNVTEQHRSRQAIAYQAHLLENVSDAIIATDMNLRLTAWNQAAEKIFGWKRDEVLGKDVNALLKPSIEGGELSSLAEKVQSAGMFEGVTSVVHRSGRMIPVEARVSTLRDANGRSIGYVGIQHDITRRLNAEEQAYQSHKRLAAQAEISRLMGSTNLDYQKMLTILATRAAELLGDACVVTQITEDGQELIPVAYHHPDADGLRFLREVLPPMKNRLGQGFSGIAAQTGQTLLVPFVPQDEVRARINPDAWKYLDRFGVHSVLILPMKIGERVVGTVGLTRDRPGKPYTLDDQLFIEALAGRAAQWIANAALYEKARQELVERRRVEAELYEIQRRLNDGIEAERLQLARELHDGPIQDLYGVVYQLHGLSDELPEGSDNENFAALQASIQHIVNSLRLVTMELRPPTLTRIGLGAAIMSHCELVRRAQPQLAIVLDLVDEKEGSLMISERVRLALYRIFQVALTNVVRHAQASQVTIRLTTTEQHAELVIEDNGVGFSVPNRWVDLVRQGHLGLVGARERVEALGGTMDVISGSGQVGTILRVVVPREA